MPILGRLIVDRINGALPQDFADIWAYHHQVAGRRDRSRDHSVLYRLDADVAKL